mmetsp:Transcript_4037/g.3372  ORF Transcript_4037/g.3372 Transcript_4037/m.3372 type:complete len:136 (+) Transcript_4037:564-971(+)
MAEEIEFMQETIGNLSLNNNLLKQQIVLIDNEMNQSAIKHDLELSFLKTKVNLLEETLNNKTKDLETLEAFKENNSHLLSLLDKYDDKLSYMQDDIDIRDLRINEFVEKYENGLEELNLDIVESKVKFLIGLLER